MVYRGYMGIDHGFDAGPPTPEVSFVGISSEFDPSIFDEPTRENLNSLKLSDEQVATIATRISNDESFTNQHPFFINLRLEQQQIEEQTQVILLGDVNPGSVSFQEKYVDAWGRTKDNVPGARAFTEAERVTDGDSSFLALAAAATGSEQGRQRLYHETSRVLTEAIELMDLEELGERLQAVYGPEDNDLINLSPASLVRIHRGGAGLFLNADFYAAYQHLVDSGAGELAEAMRQEVNDVYQVAWAKQVKDLTQYAQQNLQDERLDLQAVKNIELISHLFDVEQVIKEVAQSGENSKELLNGGSFEELISRLEEKIAKEEENNNSSLTYLHMALDNINNTRRSLQHDIQNGNKRSLDQSLGSYGLASAIVPFKETDTSHFGNLLEVAHILSNNENSGDLERKIQQLINSSDGSSDELSIGTGTDLWLVITNTKDEDQNINILTLNLKSKTHNSS